MSNKTISAVYETRNSTFGHSLVLLSLKMYVSCTSLDIHTYKEDEKTVGKIRDSVSKQFRKVKCEDQSRVKDVITKLISDDTTALGLDWTVGVVREPELDPLTMGQYS